MTRHPCILLALLTAAAAPASADVSGPAEARGETAPRVRGHRGDGPRVAWAARSRIEAQRKRARRSGFSGKERQDGVKMRVEIDRVRGFDDPRTKTTCTLDLVKGERVMMLGRGHEGWILVETPAGDIGWIPAAAVTDGGRFVGDPRLTPAEAAAAAARIAAAGVSTVAEVAAAGTASDAAPDAGTASDATPALRRAAAASPSRVAASLVVTVGAETFALRQADAMAIAAGPLGAVAAAARVRVASQMWIGLAGTAGFSSGELTYYGAAEPSQPMATRDVVIDASAEAGWGGAWSVAARAGYHYATLDIESERAEPMLVGERIGGPTVGLGATAPIGRRVAVAAAIDVMPSGRHAPSEAGVAAATSVRGAWASGTVTVRLPAHLALALVYRGGAVDAALPDGTTRNDRSHAVTAGVGVTW